MDKEYIDNLLDTKNSNSGIVNGEGANTMLASRKIGMSGLTKDKKEILKRSVGKCSSKIDLNKIKDEWKHANN